MVLVAHLQRADGARATVLMEDDDRRTFEGACSALGWKPEETVVANVHRVPVYVIDVEYPKDHVRATQALPPDHLYHKVKVT
jgi:hypothetical protein